MGENSVLIAVLGETPQIITETLYGLMVQPEKPVRIDEIFILTTLKGRQHGISALLGENGQFNNFCREYGFSDIRFTEDNFIVLGENAGLADIRSMADNSRAAEQIVSFIKTKTADPDTVLHGSIAGGRKTMGVYLALGFQLYGRPQDRLYHVLVNEEFEFCREFFYPPPDNRQLTATSRDGKTKTLWTGNARVDLASIPFISVRKFSGPMNDLPFEQIVVHAQQEVDACPRKALKVDHRTKRVMVGDVSIRLKPADLAFYSLIAFLKKRCVRKHSCADCDDCYLTNDDLLSDAKTQKIFLEIHRDIAGKNSAWAEKMQKDIENKQAEFYHQSKSRINSALKKHLFVNEFALVCINNKGLYGLARYGILQDKSLIA